jgi:hypothetical protein
MGFEFSTIYFFFKKNVDQIRKKRLEKLREKKNFVMMRNELEEKNLKKIVEKKKKLEEDVRNKASMEIKSEEEKFRSWQTNIKQKNLQELKQRSIVEDKKLHDIKQKQRINELNEWSQNKQEILKKDRLLLERQKLREKV